MNETNEQLHKRFAKWAFTRGREVDARYEHAWMAGYYESMLLSLSHLPEVQRMMKIALGEHSASHDQETKS